MDSTIQWRFIADLPDYEVSNSGLILHIWSGAPIPTCKTNNGYLKTNLILNGARYSQLVHRIVMREFVGDSKLQVNHIDGNKENNCLENLEYATQSENIRHGFEIGLYNRKGENNPAAKLKKEQVGMIRDLTANGKISQRKIALLFGISQSSVSKITNGKKWMS